MMCGSQQMPDLLLVDPVLPRQCRPSAVARRAGGRSHPPVASLCLGRVRDNTQDVGRERGTTRPRHSPQTRLPQCGRAAGHGRKAMALHGGRGGRGGAARRWGANAGVMGNGGGSDRQRGQGRTWREPVEWQRACSCGKIKIVYKFSGTRIFRTVDMPLCTTPSIKNPSCPILTPKVGKMGT